MISKYSLKMFIYLFVEIDQIRASVMVRLEDIAQCGGRLTCRWPFMEGDDGDRDKAINPF